MFQELKYAVNIFACVITQLHVLHTALSVPQMMTYIQADVFNLEKIHWDSTYLWVYEAYLREFTKSSDQWYEKSIKVDVKSILLCNSNFPNSTFHGVLEISWCTWVSNSYHPDLWCRKWPFSPKSILGLLNMQVPYWVSWGIDHIPLWLTSFAKSRSGSLAQNKIYTFFFGLYGIF